MIKVYVAGAYSDNNVINVLKNIGRGQETASELFLAGFAPFTPWHDKTFVIENWRENFTTEMFYNYSLEWLKVSDAVLIVPEVTGMKSYKDSGGTQKEIETAIELGIPVFYTFWDLKKHFKM